MIKKQNGKFVLHTKDGSKVLGTFPTLEEAKERERQISYFKYMNAKGKGPK